MNALVGALEYLVSYTCTFSCLCIQVCVVAGEAQQSVHEWVGRQVPDVATGVFSWEDGFRMMGLWGD